MKEITKIVEDILIRDKKARNSDYYLWAQVCRVKNGKRLNDPFICVIEAYSEYDLPRFESVSRARRKIQEKYTELKGCESVQRERAQKEQEYHQYGLAK